MLRFADPPRAFAFAAPRWPVAPHTYQANAAGWPIDATAAGVLYVPGRRG
jgi:hypothetical protein